MILCLIFSTIGTAISFTFEKISNSGVKQRTPTISFVKNLNYTFKHIFKSNRLKALILYASFFASLLSVFRTFMNSLLVSLYVPEMFFGFINAGIQIVSAFSSRNQNFFHKKLKNRTLTFFAIPLSSLILLVGLCVIAELPIFLTGIVVFCMIFFYALVKGPYYTLIKRYLNSFVPASTTSKVYAANTMIDSVFRSLTYFSASFLLKITTTPYAYIVLGSVFTIIFIIVLDYMKTRVGLAPEEYKPSDIQIDIK